jgi:hypothetical protein
MLDIKMLADAYADAPDELHKINPYDLKNFKALINRMYSEISKTIYFEFVDFEPYGLKPRIQYMLPDFRSGRILIHTSGNDSNLWDKFHNLQFRAIHDFIHCLHNLDFTHRDEHAVMHKQLEYSYKFAEQFPNLDWKMYEQILRSEIIYQSAVKEVYGEFHIDQKIILQKL